MELEDIEISLEDYPARLCKYCRSEIDRLATVCPVCRRDQTVDYRGLRVAFALFMFSLALILCGWSLQSLGLLSWAVLFGW